MATNTMPPLKGAPPSSSTTTIKKTPTYAPNQTLYVTNIPSAKIQKEDLRLCLYTLFTTYGPILDVVALKTQKMRGQAHVVFRDVQAATQAMRALQGFEFLGREMQIQYAKSKSDTIAKLDGTFNRPTAAAGVVVSSELQQSIFNGPPPAGFTNVTPAAGTSTLKPPPAKDTVMEDAASPAANSVAGQKRRREDDDDEGEEEQKREQESEQDKEDGDEDGSEGDAAMEEDSDDD